MGGRAAILVRPAPVPRRHDPLIVRDHDDATSFAPHFEQRSFGAKPSCMLEWSQSPRRKRLEVELDVIAEGVAMGMQIGHAANHGGADHMPTPARLAPAPPGMEIHADTLREPQTGQRNLMDRRISKAMGPSISGAVLPQRSSHSSAKSTGTYGELESAKVASRSMRPAPVDGEVSDRPAKPRGNRLQKLLNTFCASGGQVVVITIIDALGASRVTIDCITKRECWIHEASTLDIFDGCSQRTV